MVIQALAENNEGGAPSAEDLSSWASQYSLTFPVLSDEGWAVNNRFEQDNGIPTHVLIAPGGEVIVADDFSAESRIEALLPY